MLLPLRPQSAAEREHRWYCSSLVSSFLPPPVPSLHSLLLPSVHPLSSPHTHPDLRIASSGIMTNDSPEEETRAPGGSGGGGGGGGVGGGRVITRRNRADDNVTILTSSMDLHRASRSRASSSNDAAPSFTSSVDLSTSSLELSIQTRIFKIIVIGDSNVGKTCLTFRFTGGSFPDKTEATIGVDFREKAVEIEGETIKVQVWDTAGQERFRKSMVEHYYRNVHAVVFVYDVTKMASFRNLQTWIEECNGHRVSASVPRVLVGNKCDLVDQIQVPSNMALKFADSHNMLLFETSAKDPRESQNVDSIFMSLACRLKAQKSLLYRDVEREDGRVRLTQETETKSSCPC
ncbi:ras-related protein Rab-33A isoform X1 [Thunnus albacares]|uniref:ras-related protein Rab-33A n=2 Tax=Thunnus TaxID=8234 RepID=UPI001C4B3503|nr:ras-related protein Rab-33A [Thunnus maccoyii]XP_044220466.1 ras-related protein Rab-33A isoform X1 [Thunnus albacares]